MGTSPQATFYFIPHTHWEGAVFKTREEYLAVGLPNIVRALALLKRYPHYRFTLDQTCYVKPFLERYPEEAAAFRQFVAEGRLALVGGTVCMPDVNLPGGESFIRQMLYGKRYFRETFGVDVTVSWQLDTFGHHAQMPQLLRLAGYRSFWFFRGVSGWDVPAEFEWEGLDGSRIPAFWLAHGYAVTYGSPATLPEFARCLQERYALLAPVARAADRVGLAGADVCEPEEHVPPLVQAFNELPDRPFELRLAVPADYEAVVARRSPRPVIRGELNPVFQGVYSSRIELKQRTRELERLLTTAEKLGVLLGWLGVSTDREVLWNAWEPLLFNHAHDLMSGVMTDHVYVDSIRSYDFARRLADEELTTRLRAYAQQVDTRGDGVPVVVFNAAGQGRTDLVAVQVAFGRHGVTGLKLVATDGAPVPYQLMEAERYRDGSLVRVRLGFVATDVPALGHAVYRVLPVVESAPVVEPVAAGDTPVVLENEFLRVEIDAGSGAITGLVHKPDGWQALRAPANVVAREPDHGDFWELYRPLDGGSRIAMKEQHAPPRPGEAWFSNEPAADVRGTLRRGPVLSEYEVSRPLPEGGSFRTTVRLGAGQRRVEISTRLLNRERFVRYRVLFPTSVCAGHSVHEIPFGAIARPTGIEFPAQNWVDYADGKHGLALLNRGLPGNNVSDGTLMLSLVRSTRIVAYGFGGGYEPGMTSDSGFETDRELVFEYALMPHTGDWRTAGVHLEGQAFNQPLLAATADLHPGRLPARWEALSVGRPQVVVSALMPGQDGAALLRVYEATGRPATGVHLRLPGHLLAAEEVDLMDTPVRGLTVTDGGLRVDLGPFQILTVRLRQQIRDGETGARKSRPPARRGRALNR